MFLCIPTCDVTRDVDKNVPGVGRRICVAVSWRDLVFGDGSQPFNTYYFHILGKQTSKKKQLYSWVYHPGTRLLTKKTSHNRYRCYFNEGHGEVGRPTVDIDTSNRCASSGSRSRRVGASKRGSQQRSPQKGCPRGWAPVMFVGLLINPMNTIVISAINHSEMGNHIFFRKPPFYITLIVSTRNTLW